ncbi:TonB-dependent receptor [Phenylobacterium sp. CCH9-H3]|uniref:TonB-dependent receptor n=3 Tax=unclassified Phenylobacterium TaxID=2640670 RepID=UPI000B07F782|nr:TonB-dependent receptor [Phenylobacterium sp. CCH9-H3]
MPARRWAVATVAVACGVAPAAHAAAFRIPPGSVGEVVAALGVQARITIAVTDVELASRRSPGVRGEMSVREALAQALQGTGAEAVFYDAATARIVRKPPPAPPTRPPPPPGPAAPADLGEIVVTASKQTMLLDRYPGSATIIDFAADRLARDARQGTAAITETLPTLSATNLGRGRNKLYVRGVSDSSFNGPSPATVGQYLGDVRLNYSAPDPDLNLYDLARVEVLAGPQGTLYGASSLGGIVRLVPNAPETTAISATASAGVSTTHLGGIGRDAAAMLNLPLAGGRSAARLVIYGTRDAGYIDDPSRDLRDINAGRSVGGRLAWRIDDLDGWQVDVGGVLQNVSSDDGQYTLRGAPPLTRASTLAQPFRSEYRLGHLTARRAAWSGELLSTTSVVEHDLATVFDATGADGAPRRFQESNDILLVSHETRLSGGDTRTPWVAGLAGVYSVNRLTRTLGPPDAPEQIAGVLNRQIEVAVFGQVSRRIGSRLTATAGGAADRRRDHGPSARRRRGTGGRVQRAGAAHPHGRRELAHPPLPVGVRAVPAGVPRRRLRGRTRRLQ